MAYTNAFGCRQTKSLTEEDYSHADIVFVGTVIAIHPTFKLLDPEKPKKPWERDRVTDFDITFKVDDVIRGKLQTKNIRVGWIHGTFGYPDSFENFVRLYGRQLRVGLTTPDSFERDCEIVIGRSSPNCKPHFTGYYNRDADTKSYILNGGCSGPYMLPVNSDRDNLSEQ